MWDHHQYHHQLNVNFPRRILVSQFPLIFLSPLVLEEKCWVLSINRQISITTDANPVTQATVSRHWREHNVNTPLNKMLLIQSLSITHLCRYLKVSRDERIILKQCQPPYINALYCASIPSLVDRCEQVSRKFFTSLLQPSSCLHILLPTLGIL